MHVFFRAYCCRSILRPGPAVHRRNQSFAPHRRMPVYAQIRQLNAGSIRSHVRSHFTRSRIPPHALKSTHASTVGYGLPFVSLGMQLRRRISLAYNLAPRSAEREGRVFCYAARRRWTMADDHLPARAPEFHEERRRTSLCRLGSASALRQ